jgi:hypothetical protein
MAPSSQHLEPPGNSGRFRKGLKFHYVPPIDPIYFVKIELPGGSKELMRRQVEHLPKSDDFPDDFANDRCAWWPPKLSKVVASRRAAQSGPDGSYYLEIHLTEDGQRLILYLKYFTI